MNQLSAGLLEKTVSNFTTGEVFAIGLFDGVQKIGQFSSGEVVSSAGELNILACKKLRIYVHSSHE